MISQRSMVTASLVADDGRASHHGTYANRPSHGEYTVERACDRCGHTTLGRDAFWQHRLVECPDRIAGAA